MKPLRVIVAVAVAVVVAVVGAWRESELNMRRRNAARLFMTSHIRRRTWSVKRVWTFIAVALVAFWVSVGYEAWHVL